MSTTSNIYEQLQQKLDALGFGLPASAPVEEGERPEILVLKELFSPEDAEVFVAMRDGYQTAEQFASYSGYDADVAAKKLYEMSKRGLLYRRGGEDGLEYRLIPMVHGVFEFNVNDAGLPKWFVPFAEYLGKSTFMPMVTGTDTPFFRALPCNADLVEGGVLPQDDIVTIVNDMDDSFAVADCLCRKAAGLSGADLGHPVHTCMYTGEWAKYAAENGFAKKATREEILGIIRESEKAGRMVEVINSEKPEAMCSCDSHACLILIQHRLGIPGGARPFRSNYVSVRDAEACTDCGVCATRCPAGALKTDEDTGKVVAVEGMCLGCGLCASTCEAGAIKVVRKDDVYTPVGNAFSGYERQEAFRGADPDVFAKA